MAQLSDTLIFYIISTAASISVVILGIVYKSKCKIITCCGCLRVERDVAAEERIDEMEITQNQNQNQRHDNDFEPNHRYNISDIESKHTDDSQPIHFDPKYPRHYNQLAINNGNSSIPRNMVQLT